MIKILILTICLFITSCFSLNTEIALKIKPGMTFKEIENLFECHKLKIDEIKGDTFIVWENYYAESGYKNTMFMVFTRKDSILVDIY